MFFLLMYFESPKYVANFSGGYGVSQSGKLRTFKTLKSLEQTCYPTFEIVPSFSLI